ncbi:MAG: pyrroline-5-carboxylate reductase [Candidatus Ratteibacteria bacterium]
MEKLSDLPNVTLGVIGCGNMGSAMVEGVVRYGLLPPASITIADTDEEKVKNLVDSFGVIGGDVSLASRADCLLLAVKQKDLPCLCRKISSEITISTLIISVVAGILISELERMLDTPAQVVRMMPNLAVASGKGVMAFSLGKFARPLTVTTLEALFSRLGFLFPLSEEEMPLLTAISGSGPGYLFYLAEIFYTILLERGIDPPAALKIVSLLFDGTGSILSKGENPERLKDCVSSPGGTTIAGLRVLESYNIFEIFKKAVDAAEKRAKELSNVTGGKND